MSLNTGDLIESLPGSWASEYRVIQCGFVDKTIKADTPYMAVARADFMCPNNSTAVLVQTKTNSGKKMKTVARRDGWSWDWFRFKFGKNPSDNQKDFEVAFRNGVFMSFQADTADTAKIIVESMCRMFHMRGAVRMYVDGNVYVYRGFRWAPPADMDESATKKVNNGDR